MKNSKAQKRQQLCGSSQDINAVLSPISWSGACNVHYAQYLQQSITIMIALLGIVCAAPAHAIAPFQGDKVYYTELTCDPKQDVFSAYSKVTTLQELEGKFDARSVALKRQGFAIFLNEKLVGEKAFKDTCRLKRGITIEVDINYDSITTYCKDKIPEKYLLFKKYEDFKCIMDDRGNYLIKDHSATLAAISTMLLNNNIDFILKESNLVMYSYIETHTITDRITLRHMKNKPLLMKSTPDPAILFNDFQEIIK